MKLKTIYFWYYTQPLDKWYFKNISHHVESKTVLMNFLYSVTLRFIGCSYCKRLFYHVWFFNRVDWSFGKYWSGVLVVYSKCWQISLYNIKNQITFLNITTLLILKVLGTSKLSNKLTVADTIFPKSDFLWKLKFYHWQQILSVVYLDMTDSLHSFSRKCLPHTQIRKKCSLSFF